MHRESGEAAGRVHDIGRVVSRVTSAQDNRTMESLRAALASVIPTLHEICSDTWVVIGSAAAWLTGADVRVADLDLLTSVRDADALSDRWQSWRESGHQPADAERFRSRFARYRFPGLPVEVMGGLEIFGAHGWQPPSIDRIVRVDMAGWVVAVPSVTDQIRMLQRFGRPKDVARIAALQTLTEVGG